MKPQVATVEDSLTDDEVGGIEFSLSDRAKGRASPRPEKLTPTNRPLRHSKVTNVGSGEIRLQIDASAPLNLQFNGDMEGRSLQLIPGEDGLADLVIGDPNYTYPSRDSKRLPQGNEHAEVARRRSRNPVSYSRDVKVVQRAARKAARTLSYNSTDFTTSESDSESQRPERRRSSKVYQQPHPYTKGEPSSYAKGVAVVQPAQNLRNRPPLPLRRRPVYISQRDQNPSATLPGSTKSDPSPYAQGPAIVQPAQSRRDRPSMPSRSRPVSYYGGPPPTLNSTQAPDRGPPPAMSAHYALQHQAGQIPQSPYPSMYGAIPPSSGSESFAPNPMAQPYDTSGPTRRPSISKRPSSYNSGTYSEHAPSQYPPPVIVQQRAAGKSANASDDIDDSKRWNDHRASSDEDRWSMDAVLSDVDLPENDREDENSRYRGRVQRDPVKSESAIERRASHRPPRLEFSSQRTYTEAPFKESPRQREKRYPSIQTKSRPETESHIVQERRPSDSGRRLSQETRIRPEIVITLGSSRKNKEKEYHEPRTYKRSALVDTSDLDDDLPTNTPNTPSGLSTKRTRDPWAEIHHTRVFSNDKKRKSFSQDGHLDSEAMSNSIIGNSDKMSKAKEAMRASQSPQPSSTDTLSSREYKYSRTPSPFQFVMAEHPDDFKNLQDEAILSWKQETKK